MLFRSCGMDADARVMFQLEADEKIKVAFQQASFEEEKEEIEAAVGEEYFFIIESMKQLYDYSQLQAVLKGFDYLSDARVAMYNKHKEDLRLLKKVYKRDLGQEAYDRMFRSCEKGSKSRCQRYLCTGCQGTARQDRSCSREEKRLLQASCKIGRAHV